MVKLILNIKQYIKTHYSKTLLRVCFVICHLTRGAFYGKKNVFKKFTNLY